MSGNWTIDAGMLLSFLACLARVGGAIAFVPLPGFRNSPPIARIVLAVTISMCLRPVWPPAPAAAYAPLGIAGWALAHAAAGVGAGVAVAMLLEGFVIAAQALGLQAGYSYASTIDPTTQSDSGILQILAQLFAGLLFFSLGLDRTLVKALAAGMSSGVAAPPGPAVDAAMRLGSAMFATGVRLAFPVIAALLLVDVAAAIAGRVQAQLQLLSVAFPAKMLAGMAILAMTLAAFPSVFDKSAGLMFRILPRLGN